MSLRFGTDGVRAVAITELTPEYVLRLGRATARVLGAERIAVGRDTRVSGPVLEAAFVAGAAAEGADIVVVGVLPTPALAQLVADEGGCGAMITASHNPYTDNGVKLFGPGGRKLDDRRERAVEGAIGEGSAPAASVARVGDVVFRAGAAATYIDHISGLFPDTTLAGRRVVVDGANGSMSDVAPEVLRHLGADVHAVHVTPDGRNINHRCGATHPGALRRAVLDAGAWMGVAFDGDGDRLIAVDETGQVVDGDRIIALSALDLHHRGLLRNGTVVVTVMSNLGFHRAMRAAGIDVVVTPVGDRNVLDALEAGPFSLGGEQSGHVIHHDVAVTGDGLLAGLVLADLVQRAGAPLSALASSVMISYPQVLVNVSLGRRVPDAAAGLADEIADAEALLAGDGRVLVRASGTEAMVRVMVEAPTHEQAEAIATRLADVARARYG